MEEKFAGSRRVGKLMRRSFLEAGAGGLCLGGLLLPQLLRAEERAEPLVQPFARYADLLGTIRSRGHELRVLGYAPDRSAIVAVKTGGGKQPAIFISAGSHATEQAGVAAAVELIDRLETDHEVWVLPTRDPIGLNGYPYALSLSLGEEPSLASLEEAEGLLREQGEVLHDSEGTLLA